MTLGHLGHHVGASCLSFHIGLFFADQVCLASPLVSTHSIHTRASFMTFFVSMHYHNGWNGKNHPWFALNIITHTCIVDYHTEKECFYSSNFLTNLYIMLTTPLVPVSTSAERQRQNDEKERQRGSEKAVCYFISTNVKRLVPLEFQWALHFLGYPFLKFWKQLAPPVGLLSDNPFPSIVLVPFI